MRREKHLNDGPKLPLGEVGRTHVPGFEYIEPGEWMKPKPEAVELFDKDGHGKPNLIANLRVLEGEARARFIGQITADGAVAIEKHIAICPHCKHIADHPENVVAPGTLDFDH